MTDALFPLSLTQADIYFDQLRHGDSPLYNVGGYIRCGAVDVARLKVAHRRLVCGHDVFGIRVIVNDEGIWQGISTVRNTALPVLDLSNGEDPAAAADAWQTSLFESAFPIHDMELFAARLLKLGDDEYRYLGVAHHIIMDGWGFSNWGRLLCRLYGDPLAANEAEIRWREIALDDEKYMASERYAGDKEYWAETLKAPPALLFSPRYRHKFVDDRSAAGGRRIVEISRAELAEIQSQVAGAGAGSAHYLLAMLAVYFTHALGQNRLVFGLPFHNRKNHARKKMTGVFTSVSPLCVEVLPESSFAELVQSIHQRQKEAFRHQRYPLGHIVRDLAGPGDQRALYDVAFNYLKLGSALPFDGRECELVYLSHNHEATPLLVTLCEYGDHGPVHLQLDYNPVFIDECDIALLADRLSFLLRSLRTAFAARVAELGILPENEVRELLWGYGDSTPEIMPAVGMHQLFERQAERTPAAIAVSAGERLLTYSELNRRANHIAHRLIREGVGQEKLVGICLERTVDLPAALLGTLKAGGAYVPLDRAYPAQRIHAIIESSGLDLILVDRGSPEALAQAGVPLLALEEIDEESGEEERNPVSGVSGANLAYVIHTSGSTGMPKGVQICHANAVALLEWAKTIYTFDELAKVLFSTSLNFDISMFEIFAPLCAGGRCVIVGNVLELVERGMDITLIDTVPSAMKVLIEQNAIPRGVRVINLAGETLPMRVVNDLLGAGRCEKVFDLYGPSEDTTYSTYARFDRVIEDAPHIGRALPGTRLYILSAEGKLMPKGGVGELHIAGSGVARGYLNRPDLTAERFIPNMFSNSGGERLYRTGDLVRYGRDGILEFAGRLDDQVKIRGFRVEPAEILKHVEQFEGVKTAVVLVQETGASGKHLAVYVERKADGELSDTVWIDRLSRRLRLSLPDYMIPLVHVVKAMPLMPNGKIDRQALPALGVLYPSVNSYTTPETETEIKLTRIWAGILGVDRKRVGTTHSLFEHGGHSLLLVKFANEIRTEMGVHFSLRMLFEARDLRDLAERIDVEMRMQFIEKKLSRAEIVSEGYL